MNRSLQLEMSRTDQDQKTSLLREAAGAYDRQEYRKAVQSYREVVAEDEDRLGVEDWYRFADALHRQNEGGEALEICRKLYRRDPGAVQVSLLYAWCIYDVAIKQDGDAGIADEDQFFRGAHAIIELTDGLPERVRTPRARTVFQVVRHLNASQIDAAEDILEWTNHLDPEQLSEQIGHLRTEDGTQRELPSDRERWYSKRSKALFELEAYQECLDLCTQALRRIPEISGTNQIWFMRREALCHHALGYTEDALARLEECLAIGDDEWVIHWDLARLKSEQDDLNGALAHALEAAMIGTVEPYRWKLFVLLARLFRGKDDERARDHAELALALRNQAEWPMRNSHKEFARRFDLDVEALSPADRLIDELQSFWRSSRLNLFSEQCGVIADLDTPQEVGTIESEEADETVSFRYADYDGDPDELREGMVVEYYLTGDGGNSESASAVQVRPL